MIQERNVKPYVISRHLIMAAWDKVRSNRGSAYTVWNRMSSGSYFPSAVKLVEIPKSNGGKGADPVPRKMYLQHYSKGIPYIGGMMKPGRTYISNRTVGYFR